MKRRTDAVDESGITDLVVVCTNDRDGDAACCGAAGGEAVIDAVRGWLRDRGVLWSPVFVAETGCLGLCDSEGAAVVVQPRDEWFAGVDPSDVPTLLADLFGPDATRLGRPTPRPD